jgi:hypothetical protein
MIDEASGYREQSLKQNTRSNDKVETLMSVKIIDLKTFQISLECEFNNRRFLMDHFTGLKGKGLH